MGIILRDSAHREPRCHSQASKVVDGVQALMVGVGSSHVVVVTTPPRQNVLNDGLTSSTITWTMQNSDFAV